MSQAMLPYDPDGTLPHAQTVAGPALRDGFGDWAQGAAFDDSLGSFTQFLAARNGAVAIGLVDEGCPLSDAMRSRYQGVLSPESTGKAYIEIDSERFPNLRRELSKLSGEDVPAGTPELQMYVGGVLQESLPGIHSTQSIQNLAEAGQHTSLQDRVTGPQASADVLRAKL